jgi:hypothetical protein
MAFASFNTEITLISPNRAQLSITGTGDCHSVEITVSELVTLDERESLAETKDRIRKAAKFFLTRAAASL